MRRYEVNDGLAGALVAIAMAAAATSRRKQTVVQQPSPVTASRDRLSKAAKKAAKKARVKARRSATTSEDET